MIKKNTVEEYIEGFKGKKILIVGDVMVDAYLMGKVNRISPEAPIPIVSVKEREYRLGGAANVALNISALGAEAILCSVIGEDEKGLVFKELLKKRNLSGEGIIKSSNRKTTVKTRIISGGQHLLRVDEEDCHSICKQSSNELFDKIVSLVEKHPIEVIIMEDYDKGVLNPELIQEITALGKSKNIFTTVDPKRNQFLDYSGVDLFKPNLKEFGEGLKADINKNKIEDIKALAKEFLKTQDIQILMITLSEKGILIADKDQTLHFPAHIRDISDVSGAGDTVISVASLLLASGASLEEIAQISNTAGGLVCEKTGVVPITRTELLSDF